MESFDFYFWESEYTNRFTNYVSSDNNQKWYFLNAKLKEKVLWYKTWTFETNEIMKEILNKDNAVFIIDYIKWNKTYSYMFIWQIVKDNIDNKENLFLNSFNIEDKDRKNFDKIKENADSFALLIFETKNFYCFINDFYWISPIEYYIQYKQKYNNKLSSYSYIEKKLNQKLWKELSNILYKRIIISHKEKFGKWRIEWIYLVNWDSYDNINILKNTNECLYYKIYYYFNFYFNEYNSNSIFTMYDYKEEWKTFFWIPFEY